MNLTFIIVVVLLVAGVTLWLVSGLWRGPGARSGIEHHTVNAAVLRDHLAELEQDRASGVLSTRDLAQARLEVQRRVLDEASPAQASGLPGRGSKGAAITLAIVLPLAAMLSYLLLGNPGAITPPPQGVPLMTQADVQAMVDTLAARLARNPDDPAGWLMLARSYRYFDQYDDAAAAFAKAAAVVQTDPQALSEYAETLSRSRDRGFEGEPTQLLERALALDPQEPFALTLAGAAAFERRDYPVAIEYWQRLLALLPPDSDAQRVVADSIERARREQSGMANQ